MSTVAGRLDELSATMRSLARSRPNAVARSMVAEALQNKWHGPRILAMQALAQWGDAGSVAALRDTIKRNIRESESGSLVGAGITSLSRFIALDDAEWLLDAYFAESSYRDELLPLLDRLPLDVVTSRLQLELASGSLSARRAVELATPRAARRRATGAR